MADELEKARKRENKLADVFTAMDTLDAAQLSLGSALNDLRDLGVAQAELAELSGLSTREVSAAMKAAKAQDKKSVGTDSTDHDGAPAASHADDNEQHSDQN